MNEYHGGHRRETWDVANVHCGQSLQRVQAILDYRKCPVCGASPRTGVVYTDTDHDSNHTYASCDACDHMELI